MSKIIKKHSSFLSWVFLPSFLLVASVFAVNFLSKPVESAVGAACTTSADCNVNRTNICRIEDCDSTVIPGSSVCVPVARDTGNAACNICNACGNGVCEEAATPPEFDPASGTVTCPIDCVITIGGVSQNLCLNANGGPVGCSGATQDGCCPTGCQGTIGGAAGFDVDCTCNVPPCPPPGPGQTACVPAPGTNGDDGCDPTACVCNDNLQGGGPPITGCGGRKETPATPLNPVCLALLNARAGGTMTVVPPPTLLQSLGQLNAWVWIGTVAVPGVFYTAFRFRRRKAK